MFDKTNIGGWKIYCVNLLVKFHMDCDDASVLSNSGAKIQAYKDSVISVSKTTKLATQVGRHTKKLSIFKNISNKYL